MGPVVQYASLFASAHPAGAAEPPHGASPVSSASYWKVWVIGLPHSPACRWRRTGRFGSHRPHGEAIQRIVDVGSGVAATLGLGEAVQRIVAEGLARGGTASWEMSLKPGGYQSRDGSNPSLLLLGGPPTNGLDFTRRFIDINLKPL